MSALDRLLSDRLAADPARPLVTYYDDATGERTELSATTLANWVAKTANLLADDLDLTPGDPVAVLLPAHWQTIAILHAAWAVGAVVSTDPNGAAAAFTDGDRLTAARTADEVLLLSLRPLGRGLDSVPEGATDYAERVRVQGDRFTPYVPVPDTTPALVDGDTTVTATDLVAAARTRAEELGISGADRVLDTGPWTGPADWRDRWLTVLATGASLVYCAGVPEGADLADRYRSERVTVTIGQRADRSPPRA